MFKYDFTKIKLRLLDLDPDPDPVTQMNANPSAFTTYLYRQLLLFCFQPDCSIPERVEGRDT